jgi:hypothetical protein
MQPRQDEAVLTRTLAFMIVRQVHALIVAGPLPDAR